MATARNDERTASDPLRPEGVREVPVAEPRGLPQARPPAEGSRLPKHIVGGFQGIGDDLERRSRKSASMVRLLEQHRLFLDSAERERDLLNERLGEIVPEVQESGRALKAMFRRQPVRRHLGGPRGPVRPEHAGARRAGEDRHGAERELPPVPLGLGAVRPQRDPRPADARRAQAAGTLNALIAAPMLSLWTTKTVRSAKRRRVIAMRAWRAGLDRRQFSRCSWTSWSGAPARKPPARTG